MTRVSVPVYRAHASSQCSIRMQLHVHQMKKHTSRTNVALKTA